jgi:hypothetical protein
MPRLAPKWLMTSRSREAVIKKATIIKASGQDGDFLVRCVR